MVYVRIKGPPMHALKTKIINDLCRVLSWVTQSPAVTYNAILKLMLDRGLWYLY